MNKTENKTQGGFSNISEMQNLIKENRVVEFANNLKSLKQRLSVVGTKIVEVKKKSEKVESKSAEKPETKVAAVVSAEKVAEPKTETAIQKPQVAKPQADVQSQRQGFNRNASAQRQGGFQRPENGGQPYNRNANGQRPAGNGYQGQRPAGSRFNPTGERRFDNGRDYSGRQNTNGAQGGFNRGAGAQNGTGF
ncbi:MAG: hypothetical protein IJA23_04540, partial [Clostridia bacterium]|nr:hypothetical protein [Clostridia bacterium]